MPASGTRSISVASGAAALIVWRSSSTAARCASGSSARYSSTVVGSGHVGLLVDLWCVVASCTTSRGRCVRCAHPDAPVRLAGRSGSSSAALRAILGWTPKAAPNRLAPNEPPHPGGGITHRSPCSPRRSGRKDRPLQVPMNGAQRASGHRSIRFAGTRRSWRSHSPSAGSRPAPAPAAAAAQVKVVIVVGPVESNTAKYNSHARRVRRPRPLARRIRHRGLQPERHLHAGQGRGQGREHLHLPRPRQRVAQPVWRVLGASQERDGSQQLVGSRQLEREVLGPDLHARRASRSRRTPSSCSTTCAMRRAIRSRARADPSKSIAMQRADGYGSGFLRTGAKAVFANGSGSLSSIITDLLTTRQDGRPDLPATTGPSAATVDFQFASKHTPGSTVWMDPKSPGRYYHAVSGRLTLTATQVRGG